MSRQADVLIIGAGPAGALAAHKMAKAGVRVVVLEKSPEIKRKICGEYLCPLGLELLKEEGLAAEIVGDFLKLKGMLIVTAQGTEVVTEFPSPELYQGVSVNRAIFDANLIKRAQQSGAEVHLSAEVKNIHRSGEHWVVESNQGTYMARVLIGADGRRSIVSKCLDNDIMNDGKRVAIHAFAFLQTENIRQGEMHLFADGAYIGINPTGTQEVNFSLVLDANDLQKLGGPLKALNAYLSQSSQLSKRFHIFENEAQVKATFPIQHRTKTIIPSQNVALIGDAAGFVDPLTGEGMYNALLSSQILADEIIKDLKTSLFVQQKTFARYKYQYSKVLNHKIMLNRFFQIIIRRPKLVEGIARFLLKRQSRADAFIGIIGNIYSPLQGFLKLI
jgi:menaquinone-9 beta-reductase